MLDKELKLSVPGAFFAPSYGKTWDGYTHFITPKGKFLTGLLDLVTDICVKHDIEVSVVNAPPEFDYDLDLSLHGIELRQYQKEAVLASLEARRGILSLATNAGKTEIAIALINSLKKVGQTLWLTHSLDLADQSSKRILGRTGLPVSLAYKGKYDLSGRIVVSTVQTMSKKLSHSSEVLSWLNKVPIVILDECHLGSADTWVKVVSACEKAYFRFGLSGTPYTDDKIRNRKLTGILGPVVYHIGNLDLIDLDVSAVPTVFVIPFQHKEYLDYQLAVSRGVVHNIERNNQIINVLRKAEPNTKGLVMVQYISHGNNLESLCKEAGIKAKFVSGNDTLETRISLLEELKSGELNFLISTNIFDLGIDVPELDWVFLASPTKSVTRVLQRIGRVLRKSTTKDKALVYMFQDEGDFFLKSASHKMLRIVKAEGFEII
jgi:superfamily II DNA or RNA helicase